MDLSHNPSGGVRSSENTVITFYFLKNLDAYRGSYESLFKDQLFTSVRASGSALLYPPKEARTVFPQIAMLSAASSQGADQTTLTVLSV